MLFRLNLLLPALLNSPLPLYRLPDHLFQIARPVHAKQVQGVATAAGIDKNDGAGIESLFDPGLLNPDLTNVQQIDHGGIDLAVPAPDNSVLVDPVDNTVTVAVDQPQQHNPYHQRDPKNRSEIVPADAAPARVGDH